MNTKTKGDVGELLVAAELTNAGWIVSFPFSENARYDLIAEKNSELRRIHVKTVNPKKGILELNCRSSNNLSVIYYSPKDFEFLAAVDLESKEIYYIPSCKLNKNSLKLRLIKTKNSQKKKINLASNFKQFN